MPNGTIHGEHVNRKERETEEEIKKKKRTFRCGNQFKNSVPMEIDVESKCVLCVQRNHHYNVLKLWPISKQSNSVRTVPILKN